LKKKEKGFERKKKGRGAAWLEGVGARWGKVDA
jgi:hypothetical protein